jgi:AcrR family transcriptional regulator
VLVKSHMPATASAQSDHRPRVAAERRARMRRKLVESALLVFAEKGVDAPVIEDVIAAAGVSRGTFYNYFRTNAELLVAVNEELNDEISTLIKARVRPDQDPTARQSTGLRLHIGVARRFPLFAKFVARAGVNVRPGSLRHEYMSPSIKAAIKAGDFADMPLAVALDFIAGSILTAVVRISEGELDENYLTALVAVTLRGLGVSERKTAALMAIPLNPLALGPETLCQRSHARFQVQKRFSARAGGERIRRPNNNRNPSS